MQAAANWLHGAGTRGAGHGRNGRDHCHVVHGQGLGPEPADDKGWLGRAPGCRLPATGCGAPAPAALIMAATAAATGHVICGQGLGPEPAGGKGRLRRAPGCRLPVTGCGAPAPGPPVMAATAAATTTWSMGR